MSVLEIVLLVVGALIFIGSFVVPVKKEELQEETIRLAEDEVKNLVAKEMEQAKRKMSEMSEDACQEQVQKAERSMERISNEKIMAVNEYSDTVLEEIHKNHQEVVFLYDMLNDKHDTLKTTISEADKNVKDLLQQVKDSEITVKEKADVILQAEAKQAEVRHADEKQSVTAKTLQAVSEVDLQEEPKPEFKPFQPKKVEVVPKRTRKSAASKVKDQKEAGNEAGNESGNDSEEKKAALRKESADLQLQFSSPKKDNGINSNERILELHKAGKSNMAIAKELGLGIGEVKLVIDLYEGMH
ncbi:MAG: DUF6115 domain-containing protein [Lachnospiraceae bacterium]